jgi:protein phosphatase
MNVTAALRTDVGRVRKQNEDAAWMNEERGIYVVADGMGGHLAGEVASQMAIDAVRNMAERERTPSISSLKEMVRAAHEAIFAHAQAHSECAGMGTTLSVLWRGGNYVYIAHVGDSRIYRLREGKLERITQDHSLVEELVRAGIITAEQARTHPRRNVITRALGTQGENEPDLLVTDIKKGDLFLLCSDGLNGMVEDEDIEKTLRENNLERAADSLIDQALKAGGRDNVTVVLYSYHGKGVFPWSRD